MPGSDGRRALVQHGLDALDDLLVVPATAAALRKAEEIKVLETVCIADDGGYPIVLERMDRARVTGPQIAWNKAFTAAGHKRSTHLFNQAPNGPALPATRRSGSS